MLTIFVSKDLKHICFLAEFEIISSRLNQKTQQDFLLNMKILEEKLLDERNN